MARISQAIKTEDCPCEGNRAWAWHKTQQIPMCERARDVKYGNAMNWHSNLKRRTAYIRRVLKQNPGRMRWLPGTPIFLDEEEVMA